MQSRSGHCSRTPSPMARLGLRRCGDGPSGEAHRPRFIEGLDVWGYDPGCEDDPFDSAIRAEKPRLGAFLLSRGFTKPKLDQLEKQATPAWMQLPSGRTVRVFTSNAKRFKDIRTHSHQRHCHQNIFLTEPPRSFRKWIPPDRDNHRCTTGLTPPLR